MKYFIDKQSKKVAYMQLYELLKEDIVKGVYPFGHKLPSKRLLAENTDVSVITVEHAYSILSDEGYIETRQRSGYFVIYKEKDFISTFNTDTQVQWENKKHIHQVKSQFPYSVLVKTMRKVILDYNDSILVKSPNYGCRELRSAISAYLARSNGMDVTPEQIIIGSGAEYLYSLIAQLLGNNRVFALEKPSYDKIHRVYEANRVECEFLDLGSDGIKSNKLKQSKATVLHITPFNSYPSGITATVSKRYEYLQWAEKVNGYIIEDNFESELTVSKKNEDTIFSLSKNNRVIYLNTFSKTIAPSMRVGYMILPKNLLEEFNKRLGFYSCTVPVFEQYVLAQLLSSGDFERHINRVRRARRKAMNKEKGR